MLACIKFLDRHDELDRLERLTRRGEGGLAVVWGRRRVGKTRLLVEWATRHDGVYFVADQSAAVLQRAAFATAVARRLPGFAEVTYPTWRALFERLGGDAVARRFRGPLVVDELPYLVLGSPELPSVLQAFVDHQAREARLVLALAGSSQRMMQGLVLDGSAPLYGRAEELMDLQPLRPRWVAAAAPDRDTWSRLVLWTATGGVPRYLELFTGQRGPMLARIERLVLDPLGPLHHEPDRLLHEELPPAIELRALLEAIGGGAHRVAEIAGRLGTSATGLSRPLERLTGLGLVRREVPFGENPRSSKRSVYRLADPFLRLWFRVVAPRRGNLVSATPGERMAILEPLLVHLVAEAWEELARDSVSHLATTGRFGKRVRFLPAGRWWQGNAPEWDVVSTSPERDHLLVGEVKSIRRPASQSAVRGLARALLDRTLPPVQVQAPRVHRVLFISRVARGVPAIVDGVHVVTAEDVMDA